MGAGNIVRIERLNYAMGGLMCIVAALTRPQAEALGVAVGVALTCLNFFLLRRLVFKWTAAAATGGDQTGAMLLMLPKMALLMGAVVLSLWLLPISAPAFAVGFSVFMVSIIVEVIWSVFSPSPSDPASSDHVDPNGGSDQP